MPTRVRIDGRRAVHDADIGRCCDRGWRCDIPHAGKVAQEILACRGGRSYRVELQSAGACVIGRIHAGGGGDRGEVDRVSQSKLLHLQTGHIDSQGQDEDKCGHENDGI